MPSPPTPEDLLIHGPFLRRLARRLLRDEGEAEDVVQQTWLAAVERPPQGVRNPAAWLATITKRLAGERRRRGERRRAREALVARTERVPSTAEIAARESVRQAVVTALLTLDEPYREALLLRFYEDLPPRRIAALLELPVETVRTRIKRGVARLGQALDAEHAGDRERWLGLLAPWARGRWSLLAAAAGTPLLLVGTALLLTVAVLLVDAWPRADRATLAVIDGAPVPTGGARATADDALADAAPDAAPAPPEALLTGRAASLVGRLRDGAGRPVADARVTLAGLPVGTDGRVVRWDRTRAAGRLLQRTVRSDGDGRYSVPDLDPGQWIVCVDDGRTLTVAATLAVRRPAAEVDALREQRRALARAGGRQELPLLDLPDRSARELVTTLPDPSPRTLHVVAPGGGPVADVELLVAGPGAWLGHDAEPWDGAFWEVLAARAPRHRSAGDGRLVDVPLVAGGWLALRAPGHGPRLVPIDEALLAAPVPVLRLEPLVPVTVAGRVVDARGAPLADVPVLLAPSGGSLDGTLAEAAARRLQLDQRRRSDALGRFRFDGVTQLAGHAWDSLPLGAGGSLWVHALPPSGPGVSRRLEVAPGRPAEGLVLELSPGDDLRVTLRDHGRPLVGARLRVQHDVSAHCRTWSSLTSDAEGRASLAGLRHGPLRLELDVPGAELATRELPAWDGAPLTWDVDLVPAPWVLDVWLADGVGRDGRLVRDTEAGPVATPVEVLALAADPGPVRAGAPSLPPGPGPLTRARWLGDRARLTLRADHGGDQAWVGVLLAGEVLAWRRVGRGESRLDLSLPSLEGGGLVAWRVLVRGSLPVARAWLEHPEDGGVALLSRGLGRDTWAGLVRPGRHDLVLEGPNGDRQVLPGLLVSAASDAALVELDLPEPAGLVPVLVGDWPAGGSLRVDDEDGRPVLRRVRHDDGPWPALRLPPGRLTLTCSAGDRRARATVTLLPGEQRVLELTAAPATPLTLDNGGARARLRLRDGTGALHRDQDLPAGARVSVALDPGSWQVEAWRAGGVCWRGTVVLPREDALRIP